MPDTIGNITVPTIAVSGTFPIVADYPWGRTNSLDVAIHQFGAANAKLEQRFLIGGGAREFSVKRQWLRDTDRVALRNFWENKYGPYGAFTYNLPNDDGNGTTAVPCRFKDEPLSWTMVADWACSVGINLVELPVTNPTYALTATQLRFPSSGLQTALLSQVQQMIPLIKVTALQAGYPVMYLSDRRCIVGSQQYQARLLGWDGITQGMGNEADSANFTFGNGDRVMRDLANDVDLYRASLEFSLFHVGTGIKLDLWKGDIIDWTVDAGPQFKVTASDGLYELNLPYPTRKVSRTCWKVLGGQACPYDGHTVDLVHFPSADTTWCDKNYDTANGCLAHQMKKSYGGIIALPQTVSVLDNSTGVFGFGRSPLTSTSIVNDSIYDQVMPEIYTDADMPVNCKMAAGRDESDFYEGLGIIGEGPIVAYSSVKYVDPITGATVTQSTPGAILIGSTLDGQLNQGWPNQPMYGLRQVLGNDPAADGDWFSCDQSGNATGGDWRKVYAGASTYLDNYAAGTAFIVIRRSDAKGLQLSRPGDHAMVAYVNQGLRAWVWTSPGTRSYGPAITNPVWIAVNMLLRARGLRLDAGATTAQLNFAETLFDVNAALAAASICNSSVTAIVGAGSETQFRFRGSIQEEKPLRDWIQEVLMNCLGYYTFAFGKMKIGIRENSSSVEAFTSSNILFRSLQLGPVKPSFNHLTANFADSDFQYAGNSVTVYDIDHATTIGGGGGPQFLKSTVNLCGTFTKSQAARIVSTRLREELGGITAAERKAARKLSFKTTVLSLNTEPGMVCSMTHEDMPGGAGEFRITSWKLNPDYSIDVQGQTTTDSMYDLVTGPKPADVVPSPGTDEQQWDNGVPGIVMVAPSQSAYNIITLDDISVTPDASGNANLVTADSFSVAMYVVPDDTLAQYGTTSASLSIATDPATIPCVVTGMGLRVGDYVVFDDPAKYECVQIAGPGAVGDDVVDGNVTFQRAYPGVPAGQATFGTLLYDHASGVKFRRLVLRTFQQSVSSGFFNTPGIPARTDFLIINATVVVLVFAVHNAFGYSPYTVYPLTATGLGFHVSDTPDNALITVSYA